MTLPPRWTNEQHKIHFVDCASRVPSKTELTGSGLMPPGALAPYRMNEVLHWHCFTRLPEPQLTAGQVCPLRHTGHLTGCVGKPCFRTVHWREKKGDLKNSSFLPCSCYLERLALGTHWNFSVLVSQDTNSSERQTHTVEMR